MSRSLFALFVGSVVCMAFPQISSGYGGNSFLGKSLSHWKKQLNSTNPKERRSAAFAIGKIQEHAVAEVPMLLKIARNDENPAVRDAAAYAIGEICKVGLGGPSTDDPELPAKLRAAFRSEKAPLVRRSLVYAIGCLPRAEVINSLRLLNEVVSNPKENPAVRQNAAWALGQMDASAVNSLRKALRDSDNLVKRDAAMALLNYKEDAAPALRELLECLPCPNSEVRKAASSLLVDIVTPQDADVAKEPLVGRLVDPYEEIRWNAALALGNIGGPAATKAVDLFVTALKSKNIRRIRQAAGAINTIGPTAKPAIPTLLNLLDHKNKEVRQMASVALGGIQREATTAIPKLVQVVTDRSEAVEVRRWAADAILRIGQDAMKDETIQREGVPQVKNAVPILTKVIADKSDLPLARNWAMIALFGHGGHLRYEEALLQTLEETLKEPKTEENRKFRYDSAFLLGRLRGPKATKQTIDTLGEYLKDKTFQIYTGKVDSGTSGTGVEKGGGNVKAQGTVSGDARVLPLSALDEIGGNVVKTRPAIIQELKNILQEKEALPEVKAAAKELLANVKKAM
ncbi:MAG: HEAT repeat domain-containing protein [Gemmataceae bacterium]